MFKSATSLIRTLFLALVWEVDARRHTSMVFVMRGSKALQDAYRNPRGALEELKKSPYGSSTKALQELYRRTTGAGSIQELYKNSTGAL